MVLKFFDKVKNLFRPRPNFARLSERSPAALLALSRTQQKSFLFLLEEKIGRAQIKKCEENFFAGWRALASGGGTECQFRSKKFRAKFRISHQSQLSPFWERIASRLRRSAGPRPARRDAAKSHGSPNETETFIRV